MTPPEPNRRPPDESDESTARCPGCGRAIDSRPVPKRCRECGEALTDHAEVERFLQ